MFYNVVGKKNCTCHFKGILSDAWVVPANEIGQEDKTLHCVTHLGHILKDGDTAFGFHLKTANYNDPNFNLMKTSDIPDVVSVSRNIVYIFYLLVQGIVKEELW